MLAFLLALRMEKVLSTARLILLLFVVLTPCLLYTSDAADERSSVDLGGRRIINTKTWI